MELAQDRTEYDLFEDEPVEPSEPLEPEEPEDPQEDSDVDSELEDYRITQRTHKSKKHHRSKHSVKTPLLAAARDSSRRNLAVSLVSESPSIHIVRYFQERDKLQAEKKIAKIKTHMKDDSRTDCDVDETKNPLGPHKCFVNSECTGMRICTTFGWCRGKAMCTDEERAEACDVTKHTDPTCKVDEDCLGARLCENSILPPGSETYLCEATDTGC